MLGFEYCFLFALAVIVRGRRKLSFGRRTAMARHVSYESPGCHMVEGSSRTFTGRFELLCSVALDPTTQQNDETKTTKTSAHGTYCKLGSHLAFLFLAWSRNLPRNGLVIGLRG